MPTIIYRSVITTIFCCFTSAFAFCQQEFVIKGVVSKKLSAERVGQVLVTNLRSKVVMMGDEIGWFSIKAAVGDTLLFSKTDYTPQKVAVTNHSDMPVYLQPVIKLNEVKIVGQTKRQELSEIMGTYRSKGIYFDGKPPITAFIPFGGSPITGLYELFGKEPKRLRHFAAFTQGEIEYAEVRRRYNVPLVKRVTGLTDSVLIRKFMDYYTPTFDDIKTWNDYELISHVRKSFDYYQKNPPAVLKSDLKMNRVESLDDRRPKP